MSLKCLKSKLICHHKCIRFSKCYIFKCSVYQRITVTDERDKTYRQTVNDQFPILLSEWYIDID